MKQKRKQTFSKTSMLLFFLKGSKRYFIISILAAFLFTGMEMLTPQIIRFTIDSVIDSDTPKLPAFILRFVQSVGGISYLKAHLWLLAIAVVLVSVFAVLGKYLNGYYNTKGAEHMMLTMRTSLFSHIQKLPYHWHMKHPTGDTIQRCTSDVDMVRRFVSEQLTSVFRIVVLIGFSLFCMFQIHTTLAIVALVAIPVIILYSTLFRMKIGGMFTECDENEGILSAITQENLTGVRVVRAFGREEFERARFEKQNQIYTEKWVSLCRILSAFWATGDLLSGLQVLLMLSLGAVFAVRGDITAGQFIAAITYNGMLIWPVRHLGRVISEMSKAGVSIDRIRAIMNAEAEANPPSPLKPDMTGDIVFSDVTYAYDNTPPLFEHLSLTIPGGRVFGILGSTGSGKSTLMHLLGRLCELSEGCGRITIGGVDIKTIDRAWLRQHIGIVLQEPYLFSRTIGENIGITLDTYDEAAVREVADVACLDQTVMGFAKGYETMVGERGVTLSGGQKQRTAIARMLLTSAPIMIFDDSLSAVDAETDAAIREQLKTRFGSATVILISHRITTLMQADTIMVLDQGKVAEMGTHEQLAQSGGLYSQIYHLQTQGMAEIETSPATETERGESHGR